MEKNSFFSDSEYKYQGPSRSSNGQKTEKITSDSKLLLQKCLIKFCQKTSISQKT